jgi:2-polyprenyl-3-methyl-5-hydroxy-6-metoxy-1,4-benzoquinol methylase
MQNYIATNRALWNAKVEHHVASDFYNMESFLDGANSLNSIELDLLGNLKGKSVLHLQCHFGQDTLALARLGATVTGIDFSEKAIAKANEIAQQLNVSASFICCDIFDLKAHLSEQFDIVFTSYGTIGWLPDLHKWANIISSFLKPNGKLVFAEFHPVVWMFDNDFEHIEYRYFKSAPIIENESGTYADKNAPIQLESITWNHSLSEVFAALLSNQLIINTFQEFDYSPYNCLNGMIQVAPRQYRIEKFGDKIPLVYALIAIKS